MGIKWDEDEENLTVAQKTAKRIKERLAAEKAAKEGEGGSEETKEGAGASTNAGPPQQGMAMPQPGTGPVRQGQ